jgi:hypothetical protein
MGDQRNGVGATLRRRKFLALLGAAGVAATLPAPTAAGVSRMAIIRRGNELITRNCASQDAAVQWLDKRMRINYQVGDVAEIHNEFGPLPFQRREQKEEGLWNRAVIENAPEFKRAAADVWAASGNGRNPNEAAVYLDKDLNAAPVQTSNVDNHASIRVPASSQILIHSLPNTRAIYPSDDDRNSTVKLGKTVYVVSRVGLKAVDKFGKVTNVYNTKDWMGQDNK